MHLARDMSREVQWCGCTPLQMQFRSWQLQFPTAWMPGSPVQSEAWMEPQVSMGGTGRPSRVQVMKGKGGSCCHQTLHLTQVQGKSEDCFCPDLVGGYREQLNGMLGLSPEAMAGIVSFLLALPPCFPCWPGNSSLGSGYAVLGFVCDSSSSRQSPTSSTCSWPEE